MSYSSGTDDLYDWPEPFDSLDEQEPKRKNKKKTFIAAAIALVFVFTIFFESVGLYFNSKLSDSAQIDLPTREDVLKGVQDSGLYVLNTDDIVTHIHASLTIIVQGKTITIPAIGADMDTMTAAPIHTHDTSGTLHIETDSTNSYAPNALDFIRLWNEGEDDLCLIFAHDAKCKVTTHINKRDATLSEVLRDGDIIVIRISLPDKPIYV